MIRQFLGIASARALNAFAQAFLLILLARNLGPSAYGVLATIISVQTVGYAVFSLNTPTYISRELSQGRALNAASAVRLNTFALTTWFIITLLMLVGGRRDLSVAILAAANSIAQYCTGINESHYSIELARLSARKPATIIATRSIVAVLIYGVASITIIGPIYGFAAARASDGLTSLILSHLLIKPITTTRRPTLRDIKHITGTLLPISWTLLVGNLRNFDNLILVAVAGSTATGIYAASTKMVVPFIMMATALSSVIMPRMARSTPAKAKRAICMLGIGGLLASALTLLTIPLSGWLVELVFGSSFAGSGLVLTFALLRVGPSFASPVIGNILQARNLDSIVAINMTIVSLLTLTAVWIGGTISGSIGAAIGFSLVSLLGLLSIWLIGIQHLQREG